MGGFARRTSYLKAFVGKYPACPIVRLDAGSVFKVGAAESAVVNRWMLEGTWRSQPDALNLTFWDIPAWQELAALAAAGGLKRQFFDLPLVSANVTPRTAGFPRVQRYIVRELVADPGTGRKLRIGISGVLYDLEDRISRSEFDVREPGQAIHDVLAEMQPKTDYRVIMIDAGVGKAISLAALNPSIDLLVVAHDYEELVDFQQVGNTLLAMPANEGRLISEVRVELQEPARTAAVHTRFVPMDRTVPDDAGMAELIRKAQAEVDIFLRGR